MKNSFKVSSLKPFIDMTGLSGDEVVERKMHSSEMKIMPDEERTVIAKISTTDVDADGDIVYSKGADLKRFMLNPVIHADHSMKIADVIANATEICLEDNAIVAKLKFVDCTKRGEDAWNLVKGGWVRTNSIGFIVKSAVRKGTEQFKSFIKDKAINVSEGCNRIVTQFELIESSIVSVPCDPLALMTAISTKSIHLEPETIIALDLPKIKVEVVDEKEVKEVAKDEEVKEIAKEDDEVAEIKEVSNKDVVVDNNIPIAKVDEVKDEKPESTPITSDTVTDVVEAKEVDTAKEGVEVKIEVADKAQVVDIEPVIEVVKVEVVAPKEVIEVKVIEPVEPPKPKLISIIRVGSYDLVEEAKKLKMVKRGHIL